MKQRFAYIISVLMMVAHMSAQSLISGTVTDGKEPLAGANVFVLGTIDGCLTDSLGRFSFQTGKMEGDTLKVTCLGFEDFTTEIDMGKPTSLKIVMKSQAMHINEVVVTASTFNFGKSDNFKSMNAHDVVMAGNSCGDIVAALQSLPGTQKVGEDGKLYVRGGSSEECQTFINGMHVLVPYSTNTEYSASRGRFSPFLFKGINFSLGGYGGEYGQALSSILPMETTDVATGDKLGISASMVNWNIGGTKSFEYSSLSFNADYTSMGLYDHLFNQRFDFTRPYRKLSGEAQFKKEFTNDGMMKSYIGYDLTSVGQNTEERNLSLQEHNIYANLTHKQSLGRGYTLFAGVANSSVFKSIDDAIAVGDHYYNFRNEVHLKSEVRKVYSARFKMQAGAEDYIRSSIMEYNAFRQHLSYNIFAAHADGMLTFSRCYFLTLSARAEYATVGHKWLVMPRATISYLPNKRLQFSLVAGLYSQTPEDEQLMKGHRNLGQGKAIHTVLSMQYCNSNLLLRIEPYWKKYNGLPRLTNGLYANTGNGYSKGLDVFLENHSLLKNLTTTLSYSFNDSKRLYLDYTERRIPEYVSRHNLRMTAKYQLGKLIFGLAETYASGRHILYATTPHYNSVDGNVTYLASQRVIVYGSVNNIFGRTNINSYDHQGRAITASRDRFFYLGIFISLKSNKAYDISNF